MLVLSKAVSSRHHEPSIGESCVRRVCCENSKESVVRNNYDSGAANDVPFENSKTSVIKNNCEAVVYHPLRYIVVLGPDYLHCLYNKFTWLHIIHAF